MTGVNDGGTGYGRAAAVSAAAHPGYTVQEVDNLPYSEQMALAPQMGKYFGDYTTKAPKASPAALPPAGPSHEELVTHTHTHTHTHTRTTNARVHTHAHTHTRIRKHIHSRTHARICKRIHTNRCSRHGSLCRRKLPQRLPHGTRACAWSRLKPMSSHRARRSTMTSR